MTLRYIDVCSGISAPTQAWKPLGWQALCFAEIETAPRSVLAHHYPDVPLRGDFTEIEGNEYGPVDLLVGGTPCQSFSVAGLRGGLGDDRGNLALEFARLADRARPRWVVWENVPGVLSSNGGRDFGSILGALAELGYGTAYSVLDAQHFGVPQRRRRVFVVGYLGDWRRAAAVLFERHSLSGHPAPRREARPGVADRAPNCPESACVSAGRQANGGPAAQAFGGGANCHPTDVATAVAAHPGGRYDIDCETFVAQITATLAAGGNTTGGNRYPGTSAETCGTMLVAYSLRGEGFDASEDGTGRSTPLVPVAFAHQQGGTHDLHFSADVGLALQKSQTQAICFSAKDHGADAMHDLSPTLRAGGHSGSHANAGVMPAVAFTGENNGWLDDRALSCSQDLPAWAVRAVLSSQSRGSPQERRLAGQSARELGTALSELSHQGASPADAVQHLWGTAEGARLLQQALSALQAVGRSDAGKGEPKQSSSAVRRLTPRECERLQGFPDNFTLVPHRNKPMADGPRYKMLGNSMAVPVLRWIGERIAMVDALASERAAA